MSGKDVGLEDSHAPYAPHSHRRQMLSDEAVATHQRINFAESGMIEMWERDFLNNRKHQWKGCRP